MTIIGFLFNSLNICTFLFNKLVYSSNFHIIFSSKLYLIKLKKNIVADDYFESFELIEVCYN